VSLTPEQIADGWKPHNGGPCPVWPTRTVLAMLRDGQVGERYACDLEWSLDGRSDDIIAYKEHNHD
jgi:hypothetical protein